MSVHSIQPTTTHWNSVTLESSQKLPSGIDPCIMMMFLAFTAMDIARKNMALERQFRVQQLIEQRKKITKVDEGFQSHGVATLGSGTMGGILSLVGGAAGLGMVGLGKSAEAITSMNSLCSGLGQVSGQVGQGVGQQMEGNRYGLQMTVSTFDKEYEQLSGNIRENEETIRRILETTEKVMQIYQAMVVAVVNAA